MNLKYFGKTLSVGVLGMLTTALFSEATLADRPAHASDYGDIPDSVLNGIFGIEPDFFDRGREQFEHEIERLNRMDFDTVTLKIEESVRFNPEVLEKIRGQVDSSTDLPQ